MEDYRQLGRRVTLDAVGEADRRLAEVAGAIDFLLAVTPVNVEEAWEEFSAAGFDREPVFRYRPLEVDPELLKRELYAIEIEQVEDPTLAALFRTARREIDRRLGMLEDRGTSEFLLGSLQLYGRPSADTVRLAEDVLAHADPAAGDGRTVDAEGFAERARAALQRYRRQHPDLEAEVQVRDDVAGILVSRGNLLVGAGVQVPEARVEAILQHELGTHVVTFANGGAQPLRQLRIGLPGYEVTQEGLAVFAEYLAGGLTTARVALLAGRVLAVDALADGATFVETFRLLRRDRGFRSLGAFGVAMRVHRAGGLTKDAIYLQGLSDVLTHVEGGGSLESLLVGKVALAQIAMVEELRLRGILRSPLLRPDWLDDPAAAERLSGVRSGRPVIDLMRGGDA